MDVGVFPKEGQTEKEMGRQLNGMDRIKVG